MEKIALVAIAYNRVNSLKRLLNSLSKKHTMMKTLMCLLLLV